MYKVTLPRLPSLTFLLLAIFCLPVSAAAYYVDPVNGSDANNGLAQAYQGGTTGPWQHMPGTVGQPDGTGWSLLQAGDRLVVMGGSLSVVSVLVSSAWYSDGTPGNLVQILSGDQVGWGSGRAIIDGGADSTGSGPFSQGFHVFGSSYIRIQGFEIRNMNNDIGSGGIYVDGNSPSYDEFVGNLIHEIYGTPQTNGYGIEITGGAVAGHFLVEKNIIYHTEEKAIELYNQGYSTIRYNYCFQTNDHAMVISSGYNTIYGNVFSQAGYHWLPASYLGGAPDGPFRPAFGFKFDSGNGIAFADYNLAYDNLVIDCSSGIGILDGSNNEIYFNTVYHSGYQGGENGVEEGSGLVIIDDGTAGLHFPSGNTVADNIFYYSNLIGGNATSVEFNLTIGNGNTVSNNVFYRDASSTGTLVAYRLGVLTGPVTWNPVSWFEGQDGFAAVGSGNVADHNVVADPGFAGGVGAALMAKLPTGLDQAFHPNSSAFSLSGTTPRSVVQGDQMGAPMNVDIVGRFRVLFSLGAYEQTGVAVQGPPPPTGLRLISP